jgi:hypothetical protein
MPSGLTSSVIIPRLTGTSREATDLFNLLQKPIDHGNGVTLTMPEFLRGVENLGGAKSYEEFVHKPAELASNQSDKDLSTPLILHSLSSSELTASSELFDRKADATLRGGTIILYTFFYIIADIDNFTWTFSGSAWGPGGSELPIPLLQPFALLVLTHASSCVQWTGNPELFCL